MNEDKYDSSTKHIFTKIRRRYGSNSLYINIPWHIKKLFEVAENDYVSFTFLGVIKKGEPSEKRFNKHSLPVKLRYDILRRDNFKCVLCGSSSKDGIRLEVHHKIPVNEGGSDSEENLQTLCNLCHYGAEK